MAAENDTVPAPQAIARPRAGLFQGRNRSSRSVTISKSHSLVQPILKPGQPGTKKLLEIYGDNLICVRYRYDDEKMTMFKTIEIIVDTKPWKENPRKIPKNKIVSIRIAIDEIDLRKRVKATGGKWDPKRQVWQLSYEKVMELGLSNRIVDDTPL